MQFQNYPMQTYLIDAIDVVLARDIWDMQDVSEDAFVDAVKDQACLMARVPPDEMREEYLG